MVSPGRCFILYVQSRKSLTKSYDDFCTFVGFYPELHGYDVVREERVAGMKGVAA